MPPSHVRRRGFTEQQQQKSDICNSRDQACIDRDSVGNLSCPTRAPAPACCHSQWLPLTVSGGLIARWRIICSQRTSTRNNSSLLPCGCCDVSCYHSPRQPLCLWKHLGHVDFRSLSTVGPPGKCGKNKQHTAVRQYGSSGLRCNHQLTGRGSSRQVED